ncbi:DoxX family protein [Haloferula chungangensis]|uniref:DoxX family protein n=1 Tax=Haloferula chungangensis TaxID=1048331 RepID=A0ABW2LA02_9BACT
MKKFLFDCGTRDSIASAGLLVLRIGFGLMMLVGHGWGKIAKFEQAKDSWPKPDLPLLSLMSSPVSMLVTIFAEVGCAGLLILGLMTRPAAFIFAFTMLVAAFQIHGGDPFFMAGGASKEPALLYAIPCIALIISGAGRWSADALLYKEKKRRFFAD